jgi:hypothetical protein
MEVQILCSEPRNKKQTKNVSLSLLVSGPCALYRSPVISLPQSLVSSVCAAVVILQWVVQSLRLALSKGPTRVGVSPSPEDGNRFSCRIALFSSY